MVPALVKAPIAGLPWPAGALERLAPPTAIRTQADMWLVSSCKRILDGLPRCAVVVKPQYKQ